MRRFCLVLLILFLWPWMPFHGTLVESQPNMSNARAKFEAFLKKEQLGTLDVETATWWLKLPSTGSGEDNEHDAIKKGLILYEAYAEKEGVSPGELSLKIGMRSVAYIDDDWTFHHIFVQPPDPRKEFQVFLTQKQLGSFDSETGTWWFGLPQERLAQGDLVNLAYGLEWYKIYAGDKGQSPHELGVEIGLSGFVYGDLKMETGNFLNYFDFDVFKQSEILRNMLDKS